MSGTGIAGAMDYRPRSAQRRDEVRCFVCGGPLKGGVSYAAKVMPPLAEVCSEKCAKDSRFAGNKHGLSCPAPSDLDLCGR